VSVPSGEAYVIFQDVTLASRLSVAFHGSDTGLRANSVISTVTDDFGVEAWVRPTAASGITSIVYNGNSATSGWGIYQAGDAYVLLYGGQVITGPVGSVDLNQWTHLALVRDSGETRLYKNGVEIASTSTGPAIPAGGFAIGANSIPAGPSEFFSGNIDEVRVFTFAAGQFALTDLQTNLSYTDPAPPVPTQSPLALLLAAIALLLAGAHGARTRAGALRSND
jgi:Concanavalin A-like lectin/glucanases superfamily